MAAGVLGCTAAPYAPGECQIVDIKNVALTPFDQINPQSFGDLVKNLLGSIQSENCYGAKTDILLPTLINLYLGA